MFGNRLGWGISAALVVGFVLIMWGLYTAGSQFEEAGAVGRNAAGYSMQLPRDPRTLATWMSDEQDAIATYKDAIADFNAHPQAYNIYIERGKLNSPEYAQIEKGVNLLVKAGTMKRPGVFSDRPQEL